MITAQVESLTEGLEELKPLLPLHYRKLALNQDTVPLSPKFYVYLEQDSLGKISYITLRDSGRLIGYWVAFIDTDLHYDTCLTASMDIWNVLEEYETSMAPLILMRAVQKEYRRRGVSRERAGEKIHRPCGRLFKAFGYEPIEIHYSKWVD